MDYEEKQYLKNVYDGNIIEVDVLKVSSRTAGGYTEIVRHSGGAAVVPIMIKVKFI